MASVELAQAEGIARRRIGGSDRRRIRARLVDEARHHRRAAAIDDRVGELRGDDFAAQAMAGNRVRKALAHVLGEIALQLLAEIRIVRHGTVEQCVVQRELRIGEQHRELGPRQALRRAARARSARRRPAGTRRCGRAVPAPPACASGGGRSRDRRRRAARTARAPASAGSCCAAPVAPPRRSSRPAARCDRPPIEAAVALGHRERDLDVDLDVGGVDAGRIVDGVGVEPHAACAPPRCGRAACSRDWRPRRSPARGRPRR